MTETMRVPEHQTFYVMMIPRDLNDFTWTAVGGPWSTRDSADELQGLLERVSKPRQTVVVCINPTLEPVSLGHLRAGREETNGRAGRREAVRRVRP